MEEGRAECGGWGDPLMRDVLAALTTQQDRFPSTHTLLHHPLLRHPRHLFCLQWASSRQFLLSMWVAASLSLWEEEEEWVRWQSFL